jgi:SOS response regulatory protein OraA/RecX
MNPIPEKKIKSLLKNYSLKLIAQSPKVESQIREKLDRYYQRLVNKLNFGQDSYNFSTILEEIIIYLKENDFINEKTYIASFIRSHPKYSRQLLIHRLKNLDLKESLINKLLPSVDSEKEQIKKIISKKYSPSQLEDYGQRMKIMASFARKGFSIDSTKNVIDSLRQKR